MSSGPETTLQEIPDGEADLRLLVFSGDQVVTHDLTAPSELVIGRSDDCQVQVDVPALSRHHAVVRVGPTVTVEDLGSSNGTRVRGRRLEANERATLSHGDVIDLGPVMLVLQRSAQGSVARRPRRLWSHDWFEGRLEEECGRAQLSGVGFTVLRLRLEGSAAPAVVQEVLAATLHPTDIIAAYGPGEYEALVFGQKGTAAVKRLKDALQQRGAPVRIGHAVFGPDGRDPERLFAEACMRIDPGVSADDATRTATSSVVVKDPQMAELHALVKRVAQSDLTVLLLGETGVGKEVFAEAVHQGSARKRGPFVRLNCSAFTESLLESELFGHEKGAFTGAVKAKAGLLESANGGTVLLDEIGEMAPSTQAKLLRVLEQREVIRVGDTQSRKIDVRFVAATHRNLEHDVDQGSFRKDLFFRLGGVTLVIPPLRERLGELESLAQHFIARAAVQYQRLPAPRLSPEALQQMKGYAWPGNLRELRNVLERATLLCAGDVITASDMPGEKFASLPLSSYQPLPPGVDEDDASERQQIIDALEASGGNQTLAARALGISRRTMLNRLDAYAIPRPRKGKAPSPP